MVRYQTQDSSQTFQWKNPMSTYIIQSDTSNLLMANIYLITYQLNGVFPQKQLLMFINAKYTALLTLSWLISPGMEESSIH